METAVDRIPYIKSDLPVGRSGDWVLAKFSVPQPQHPPHEDPRPEWARSEPGEYTSLSCDEVIFMTDTYDEWSTQREAMEQALKRGGNILTTGLGLGMIVESILKTPDTPVKHVTVVELSADVIKLVGPHLKQRYGDRLEIVHADALKWNPPRDRHFTVGWHDIWPNPYDRANLPDFEELEERYRHCCDWQGCWGREMVVDEAPEATDAAVEPVPEPQ